MRNTSDMDRLSGQIVTADSHMTSSEPTSGRSGKVER